MRRVMLAIVIALAAPDILQAAPVCVSASLADYIALGPEGCTVGDALFADFAASNPISEATPILPGAVGVSPVMSSSSVALDFLFNMTVGAEEFAALQIGYALSGMAGSSFTGDTLSMSGSSVLGEGLVLVLKETCGNGLFEGDDASACSGDVMDPLVVYGIAMISGPTDSTAVFGPTSFFDVLNGVALDGGLEGSASLGTVRNEFEFASTQVVPEPATLLLLGSGLVALCRRRRPRR